MKDSRLKWRHTRLATFLSMFLCLIAAAICVAGTFWLLGAKDVFVPMPTALGIDMSFFVAMFVAMTPIVAILGLLRAFSQNRYEPYIQIEGDNFPEPLSADMMPMYLPHKVSGKDPVWIDNTKWNDKLVLHKQDDHVVYWRSEITNRLSIIMLCGW